MLATNECPKCGAEIEDLEFLDRRYNNNGDNDVIYDYWGCTRCGAHGCDTYTVTNVECFGNKE